eukprot:IDg2406t1
MWRLARSGVVHGRRRHSPLLNMRAICTACAIRRYLSPFLPRSLLHFDRMGAYCGMPPPNTGAHRRTQAFPHESTLRLSAYKATACIAPRLTVCTPTTRASLEAQSEKASTRVQPFERAPTHTAVLESLQQTPSLVASGARDVSDVSVTAFAHEHALGENSVRQNTGQSQSSCEIQKEKCANNAKKFGKDIFGSIKACKMLRRCKRSCREEKRADKRVCQRSERDCLSDCRRRHKKGRRFRKCKRSCRRTKRRCARAARRKNRQCRRVCRTPYRTPECKKARRRILGSGLKSVVSCASLAKCIGSTPVTHSREVDRAGMYFLMMSSCDALERGQRGSDGPAIVSTHINDLENAQRHIIRNVGPVIRLRNSDGKWCAFDGAAKTWKGEINVFLSACILSHHVNGRGVPRCYSSYTKHLRSAPEHAEGAFALDAGRTTIGGTLRRVEIFKRLSVPIVPRRPSHVRGGSRLRLLILYGWTLIAVDVSPITEMGDVILVDERLALCAMTQSVAIVIEVMVCSRPTCLPIFAHTVRWKLRRDLRSKRGALRFGRSLRNSFGSRIISALPVQLRDSLVSQFSGSICAPLDYGKRCAARSGTQECHGSPRNIIHASPAIWTPLSSKAHHQHPPINHSDDIWYWPCREYMLQVCRTETLLELELASGECERSAPSSRASPSLNCDRKAESLFQPGKVPSDRPDITHFNLGTTKYIICAYRTEP